MKSYRKNMKDKVTVIGIAGGTGSGKTTVVKKLVEVLPPHYVAVEIGRAHV